MAESTRYRRLMAANWVKDNDRARQEVEMRYYGYIVMDPSNAIVGGHEIYCGEYFM